MLTPSFTFQQEEAMRNLGIEKGYVKVSPNATHEHLKYQWKSIVHKYECWQELKEKGAI